MEERSKRGDAEVAEESAEEEGWRVMESDGDSSAGGFGLRWFLSTAFLSDAAGGKIEAHPESWE
jgi:hypothetical protein